jgi:hypothetical protein
MSDLEDELEIIIDRGTLAATIEALARVCAGKAARNGISTARHWGAAAVRLEKVGLAIERLGL